MRALHGWNNGVVLTALAVTAAVALVLAEQNISKRSGAPIVIVVSAADVGDDDIDDDGLGRAPTSPLFASLAELEAKVGKVLKEPTPSPDLLHELARQARGFRAWALADQLLARSLAIAPGRVESLFLRARTQSDLGHVDAAVQMYETVLEKAPNHQKATYNLGVLARRAGKLARASELLKRAANISSGRLKSRSLLQLGLVQVAEGQWDLAAASLREAVQLRPSDARYWLELGRAERGAGRPEPARQALDKSLALNRKLSGAHAELGALFLQQGDRGKALASLARAVKLEGTNPDYRRLLAALQVDGGEFKRARIHYAWLTHNAVDEADRAYAEAMMALLNRDTGRFLEFFKRAQTLKPGAFDEAAEQAATILYDRKDYKTAEALLKPLLGRPHPRPTTRMASARLAIRQANWEQAEQLLQQALKGNEASSEAWFLLGRVRSSRKDIAGAIEAYRKSIASNPTSRSARLNLAVLYGRSERDAEALAIYGELLSEYPRYTQALLNRSRVFERSGRKDEALGDLEAAYRISPDDPQLLQRLAQLLLKGERLDRARALLVDAIAAAPADVEARLLLAEVQIRAGQRDAAATELRRSAALAGDSPKVWSRLSRLYKDIGDNAAASDAARRSDELNKRSPSPVDATDQLPTEQGDE